MRKLTALLSLHALTLASTADAAVVLFKASGTVTAVEGNAPGSEIEVGDSIVGEFEHDETLLGAGQVIPIGGGTYTSYFGSLSQFRLKIGGYSANLTSPSGSIVYADNVFGQDAIVFLFGGLPGGVFGSTFANVQFQGRGPVQAINGSGSGNGLPTDRFNTSFFGSFGDGVTSKRVFGTLSISTVSSVPEPRTWAFLIVGIGLIGMQLRKRRGSGTLATSGSLEFFR